MTGVAPHDGKGGHGEYYGWFDYLRITLAVGVYTAHAGLQNLEHWHMAGDACVHVFFALSGFLIGGILAESEPRDLPRFYFNRCTRIWIPYGIAIIPLFLASARAHELHDPLVWKFFFYKLTFVYNIFGLPHYMKPGGWHMPLRGAANHFWSICVEEQFYLLAPFFLVFLKRLRPAVVLLLVGLVGLNFVHPHLFTAISLGMLLALSQKRFGAWYLRRAPTLIILVLTLGVAYLGLTDHLTYKSSVPLVSVGIVALLARPMRKTPIGAWLGGISYPFYLNHWLVLVFARKWIVRILHSGEIVTGVIGLGVAVAMTAVLYRLVDTEILARRSGWFTSRRGLAACAAALSLFVIGVAGGLIMH
jgi:peptidoglycan/LPS O-acetylase OafA/YrhL